MSAKSKKQPKSYVDTPIADDADAFVRIKQYAKLNNVHPSTVHRWINSGRLPQPEHRSEKVVGWTRRTLQQHHADHQGDHQDNHHLADQQ